MLKPFLNDFLAYCKNFNRTQNSVKDLLRYIRQFDDYLQEQRLVKVNHITYKHVVGQSCFTAELLAYFCKIYIALSSLKSCHTNSNHQYTRRYATSRSNWPGSRLPRVGNTGMKRWLRFMAFSGSQQ